jgi:hypothetical protein
MCSACALTSIATVLDLDIETARVLTVALLPDLFDYDVAGIGRVRVGLRKLLTSKSLRSS